MSQSDGGSQRQRRAVRGLLPPVQEEIEFEEPVAPILLTTLFLAIITWEKDYSIPMSFQKRIT
jgi:hypothetical protein